MPSSPRTGRPLLIYLHGRYARSAAAEEADRQRKVAVRGTARGFAVLTLRGRLGGCSAPELEDWFCWPSNEKNADSASEFIDSWARALATAQKRADSRTRFVLGFSNGGYFAGLIASRGLLDLDAVAVAHGGLVELARDLRDKPPMLLLSADDDIAQDDMIRFDDALSHAGWPHDSYARAGGHALTDEDIEAALTFFSRAGEPLPLKPSLPLHRAVRHARDAGVGPDVQEPSSESSEPPDKSDEQDDDDPASAL
jgi:predicted esterase